MKVLKDYVRNQARPEGCIAECYLVDECIRFCGEYIQCNIDIGPKKSRNEEYDDETILEGRPISKGKSIELSDEMLKIAHSYVLFNIAEAEPFIQ